MILLAVTYLWPAATRPVILAGLVVAVLFTLLGATITLLVGGPRVVIEVGYHLVLIALLVTGIVAAWRLPARPGGG